jgi:hypothetical protein
MAVSSNEPPSEIKSVLNELTTTVSQTDRDRADKSVSEWKAKPTELTIKARKGLRDAEDYLKKHPPLKDTAHPR